MEDAEDEKNETGKQELEKREDGFKKDKNKEELRRKNDAGLFVFWLLKTLESCVLLTGV